jgi:spore germination protein YaaH
MWILKKFFRRQELYNSFLRKAADRLHENKYVLSTALAPKYSAEQAGACMKLMIIRLMEKLQILL